MIHYLFTIDWSKVNGDHSVNDLVGKYCKENNIDYHFNMYFELVGDFLGIGDYFETYTTSHDGMTNVFADDSKIYR